MAARTVTAWVYSTAYRQTVALGPVQDAVYRVAMALTEDGRRPEITLGRIAADVGRPTSSVHAALGRLRALGLLGVSARTGRTGGHRIWRLPRRAAVALDRVRHRIAVARIRRRWAVRTPTIPMLYADPVPVPRVKLGGDGDPPAHPVGPTGPVVPTGDGSGPDDPYPRRADPRESFADKMRRYGIGAWVDERKRTHDGG